MTQSAHDQPSTDTSANPAAPSQRSRGSAIRIAILIVLLVIGGLMIFERKTCPTLIASPMVQIPAPDTVTIVWEMDAPLGGGRLTWWGDDREQNSIAAERDGTRFEASIRGLAPGQSVTYLIESARPLLWATPLYKPLPATAPPPPGEPFRFVAFGDSGNASNAQADLALRIADAKPDVVIHVGDLVYPAGERASYPTHFYGPNSIMLRRAPFMPSLGNHDVATDKGAPLLDVFVCPRNGPEGIEPERNYWFDFGDARFVALDSNLAEFGGVLTADEMKNVIAPWVRKVLTDCDKKWKFVFYHHPFYTGGTHTAEGGAYMKEAYAGVFESCGVDMVFCGHNHLYERTAPIAGDEIVEEGKGVVYITTGAGGANRYAEQIPPPPYIRAYSDAVFSFTQVDVTADRLELRQIGESGEIIDEYVIDKSAGGAGS